jgi:nitrite reductase/ring-hydroxylating ferredoxin subunit/Fe-S cluster biogenesis protein NfuA
MLREDERPSGLARLPAKEANVSATVPGAVVQLRVPSRANPPPATAPQGSAAQAANAPQEGASLAPLLRDIEALEAVALSFDERERNTVQALKRAIDALHKEAFTRLIKQLKAHPAALGPLREAVADDVVYAVLRHHGLVRPSLQERIELALESVRPQLASHGGNVELVEVRAPTSVTVRLTGSCDGCSAAGLTMVAGVEAAIKQHCPEIEHVKQATGSLSSSSKASYVSPFAQADERGWVRALKLDSIPEGDVVAADVGSRSLLFSRMGTQVSCFENACAHLGLPLDMARVDNGVLICPHHGFRYSLESGECLTVPEVQLQAHAVRVLGEDVEVKLS